VELTWVVRSNVCPKASHKNRAPLSSRPINQQPLICSHRVIDLDQIAQRGEGLFQNDPTDFFLHWLDFTSPVGRRISMRWLLILMALTFGEVAQAQPIFLACDGDMVTQA
jgi:hypothetical protein